MHHDARPDAGRGLLDGGSDHGHDAARLMSCDNRAVRLAESEHGGRTGGAIELKIAAAYAGSLDFDDHIVRSRRWVWKFGELQLSFAKESHTAHGFSPLTGMRLVSVSHPTGAASCSFPRKRMALCQHIILRATHASTHRKAGGAKRGDIGLDSCGITADDLRVGPYRR
jgi:hypothetical protein